MGYSFCIVAIFGHFQNALTFRILAFFSSCFLHTTTLMCFLETFLACFSQFYFLTQTEYFAWDIAFALWPLLAIFKMLPIFPLLAVFFRALFALKNFNLFVETFFACFRQFFLGPKLSILYGFYPLNCGHF